MIYTRFEPDTSPMSLVSPLSLFCSKCKHLALPRHVLCKVQPHSQAVWFKVQNPVRCEQDSNLRGETPFDFESNALTSRPSQLPRITFKSWLKLIYSTPLCIIKITSTAYLILLEMQWLPWRTILNTAPWFLVRQGMFLLWKSYQKWGSNPRGHTSIGS